MDVLHDLSHRTWYQLGTQFEKLVPSYVLDEPLLTKESADGLPDRNYADDGRRLFPLDSPANVWLSAAYFAKHAHQPGSYVAPLRTHIESRIKTAAAVYGISEDVASIMEAITRLPEEKKASASDYGWVNGNERRYPMFDKNGVIKAAQYFVENRQLYPLEMRRTIASAIMRKAAEFGVEAPGAVRREAGHGMPRRDTLMAELLARAEMCKDAEISQAVANVNEMIAVSGMDEIGEVLDKVAEVVDALDNAEGLNLGYGKRLLAPADFLYDMDMKEAAAIAEDSVELKNYVFSIQKLAELSPAVFGDVLGEDFVMRIKQADGKIDRSKLADELYSLPTPDKAALEDHLQTALM
jgi:hypothetical protein